MNRRIGGFALFLGGIVLAGAVALSIAQEKAPTETKGMQNEELGSLDLTSEMDSVQGSRFRLRRLTLQPGGVIGLHAHVDRPTAIYLMKGALTLHQVGMPDQVLRAGEGLVEDKSMLHWGENAGTEPTEMIVADIVKSDGAAAISIPQGKGPTENKGLNVEELASMDLASEIASVQGRKLRLRRHRLLPGGVIALHTHVDRPAATYQINGALTLHQEGRPVRVRRVGEGLMEDKSMLHWAENAEAEPSDWLVVIILKE